MNYQQIMPPSVGPLTLDQMKDHLRISSNAEDMLLTDLLNAATALAESETSLAFITQSWRVWVDSLPRDGVICLPRNPVQRTTSVVWYGPNGEPQTLSGSAYFLNAVTKPARLRIDRSQCPSGVCNGIEIDFDVGFGDLGIDVPDMLRRALLMLISHWYEFRGVFSASDQPVSVPEAYTRLTRHYREQRL